MNPYDVLGVALPADDAAIRAQYLKLVRRFPPEQYPDRFAEINRAYEMIRDKEQRLRYTLFPPAVEENTPLEMTTDFYRRADRRVPLSFHAMKSYLQKCAMD